MFHPLHQLWSHFDIFLPFVQTSVELDPESGYESLHDETAEDVESLWVEKFRPKSYLQVGDFFTCGLCVHCEASVPINLLVINDIKLIGHRLLCNELRVKLCIDLTSILYSITRRIH